MSNKIKCVPQAPMLCICSPFIKFLCLRTRGGGGVCSVFLLGTSVAGSLLYLLRRFTIKEKVPMLEVERDCKSTKLVYVKVTFPALTFPTKAKSLITTSRVAINCSQGLESTKIGGPAGLPT